MHTSLPPEHRPSPCFVVDQVEAFVLPFTGDLMYSSCHTIRLLSAIVEWRTGHAVINDA